MNKGFGTLPTVEDLAERTKVTTVAMSLRVKETTKKFFERQAQRLQDGATEGGEEKRLTASALMNGLLDDYAENYEARMREMEMDRRPVELVRQALEKMATTVTRADDETLLRRVVRDLDSEELRGNLAHMKENYADKMDAVHEGFGALKRGEDDIIDLRYQFDNGDFIACELGGAGYNDDEVQMVLLSPEKWIVVTAMTDCFVRKLHGLCPECSAALSPSMMEKLAELAMETDDREELARKLAEFYADYTEQLNG